MVWLLFLHIASLVIWAAALCILLVLIPRAASTGLQDVSWGERLERLWFTRLASPAGLVTIVSGTLIFAVDGNVHNWLLLKLTVVTALVFCHVAAGLLILYTKRPKVHGITAKCLGLLIVTLLLLLSILVLVLLKPELEVEPWFS
ncbi:hypothetical protein [Alkalimonas amylolytica]|uniref:Uncharacterized protein family (UPF0093) n=1 Tax=Alkalimonas amylolytica TaxID=152573 RepID=A0A1H3ZFT2_ALKAM|nr:hypothetical protein [Alkalimonas amylolytica]SEA22639.1 Uncharacterised protein family (UPF0093) [Alkalimonas amylolytica]